MRPAESISQISPVRNQSPSNASAVFFSSLKYPLKTVYPRMSSSPRGLGRSFAVYPISGTSLRRASTVGTSGPQCPGVKSLGRHNRAEAKVSVNPYPEINSRYTDGLPSITSHARAALRNLSVAGEAGALPLTMTRTLPPRTCLILRLQRRSQRG